MILELNTVFLLNIKNKTNISRSYPVKCIYISA